MGGEHDWLQIQWIKNSNTDNTKVNAKIKAAHKFT